MDIGSSSGRRTRSASITEAFSVSGPTDTGPPTLRGAPRALIARSRRAAKAPGGVIGASHFRWAASRAAACSDVPRSTAWGLQRSGRRGSESLAYSVGRAGPTRPVRTHSTSAPTTTSWPDERLAGGRLAVVQRSSDYINGWSVGPRTSSRIIECALDLAPGFAPRRSHPTTCWPPRGTSAVVASRRPHRRTDGGHRLRQACTAPHRRSRIGGPEQTLACLGGGSIAEAGGDGPRRNALNACDRAGEPVGALVMNGNGERRSPTCSGTAWRSTRASRTTAMRTRLTLVDVELRKRGGAQECRSTMHRGWRLVAEPVDTRRAGAAPFVSFTLHDGNQRHDAVIESHCRSCLFPGKSYRK